MQIPTDPFDTFNDMFQFISTMMIVFVIIFAVVFIVVAVKICKGGANVASGFTLEAPSFVLPQSREGTRSDESQMKTVRLPDKCPNCGAALSHETIDWVGPMEARCNYCSGTVKATFESV